MLFKVHLVATGISWQGLNQIVCALRFFYGLTLGEADVPERIPYAREPPKLPGVLSADEVVRFLLIRGEPEQPGGADHRLCGRAQASEVAGLRVLDVDSARGASFKSATAKARRTAM